jgi:hypothetical protein
MLKTLLAFLALVVTIGVAKAAPPEKKAAPEKQPVAIDWELSVTDSNMEKHDYLFAREGGNVKVDPGDWKCFYTAVSVDHAFGRDMGGYTELVNVACIAGKHKAVTNLSCTAGRGPQVAVLSVATNKAQSQITISCNPRE